jgi:oxygen-independent coproporphyrinogen-3 oxidase
MGVSAISGIGDAYAQNEREAGRYAEAVSSRGLATMRGYRLTPDDRIRRSVISRLLCHTVVRKDEVEREFSLRFDEYFASELERLAAVATDGLVRLGPNSVEVVGLGRIFIRNVAMIFDPYLEQQRLAERPLFSKTL